MKKVNHLSEKTDIFIVGAPKCGTTSLARYLNDHPNIFLSEPKEPSYFSTDIKSHTIATLTEYNGCFSGAKNGQLLLDASPWYLFSKDAAVNIKAYNPDAKIIIMLRNPVDMIYSLHYQHYYNGCETLPFTMALREERNRRVTEKAPCMREDYKKFLYSEIARFDEQIERYRRNFPSCNIRVIKFDDFVCNTEEIYKSCLKFIGVSQNILLNPVNHNPPKVNRFQLLKRWIYEPPMWVRKVGQIIPSGLRREIGKVISTLNRIERAKPEMSREDRTYLEKVYQEEIAKYNEM